MWRDRGRRGVLLALSMWWTVGCASAPPGGSEVPVLTEVGTEAMPLDLAAVVAAPAAMQVAPVHVTSGRGGDGTVRTLSAGAVGAGLSDGLTETALEDFPL